MIRRALEASFGSNAIRLSVRKLKKSSLPPGREKMRV